MPMKGMKFIRRLICTHRPSNLNVNPHVGPIAELRPRHAKEPLDHNDSVGAKKPTNHLNSHSDPIATLKAGVRTVRHHTRGWLKDATQAKVWADYNAQLIHVRAQQDILGVEYNPLRTIPGRDEDGKFTFCKNVDVPKNYLSLEYLLYAYDVSQSTFKRLRQRGGDALPKQVPHNKGQCVLLDQKSASCIYSARFFYVTHQMKLWKKDNRQASQTRTSTQRKTFRKQWDLEKEKDAKFGEVYEKKSRDHTARATGAKDELVDTLNRNAKRSYSSLEKAINSWCSTRTIERWFKSHADFTSYSQNIRPLLSEGNRLKQVQFSKHVRNRWGLSEGTKILWTMRYNYIDLGGL
jgi:hypothetical protein